VEHAVAVFTGIHVSLKRSIMHRRQLLQALASLPLYALSARLMATPQPERKFLLVFLRGGYDAANLLVPISSDFYYAARPGIAIPRPGSASLPAPTICRAAILKPRTALRPGYHSMVRIMTSPAL